MKFQLLHARHILEVAKAIHSETSLTSNWQEISQQLAEELVPTTSLGFQISNGKVETSTGQITHYTLSHRSGVFSFDVVRTLARLILELRHPTAFGEILPRDQGVYQMIVHSDYSNIHAASR